MAMVRHTGSQKVVPRQAPALAEATPEAPQDLLLQDLHLTGETGQASQPETDTSEH
jgi:hypothetical protein